MHRVLQPGGRLALIWNVRDETVEWVRKLGEIFNRYEGSTPRYASREWHAAFTQNGLFAPLQCAEFPHLHRSSPEGTVERVASISFIAALPEAKRNAVLDEVRELLRTDPATRHIQEIDFPYRTEVYWCQKPVNS